MNGVNTVLYLESFVDSTAFLPPDLQRFLNNIKAIDEKCIELSEVIQSNVSQLMAMPPQHLQGPTDEFVELSNRVEQDQRLLLQFAEEKVQISQQVYDLLEMHAIELEKQIDDFEGDLRMSGVMDGSMEFYQSPSSFIPMDTVRGRTPKAEDWGPLAQTPMDSLAVPLPAMPSIKRSASNIGQKASQKRPREDEVVAVTPPAPPPLASPAPVVPAAAAAPVGPVVATAQPKKRIRSVQSTGSLLNSTASLDDAGFAATGTEQEAVEQTQVIGFMSLPPPGLQAAAPRPQAPGKYLYQSGITEELIGRHAELFWPPDSMWYLIEIQEVNADTKKARIMYTTGEVEELDLDEIARDMHMSIISLESER